MKEKTLFMIYNLCFMVAVVFAYSRLDFLGELVFMRFVMLFYVSGLVFETVYLFKIKRLKW